jgi:Peroxiredoxin
MALQPGTAAPDVTLKTMTTAGLADVRLGEHFGEQPVVLLFVPAAFTGVCTQELCDVTAGLGKFDAAGARVFGVSSDTPFALDAWAKANGIEVTLLSDRRGEARVAYDVVLPDFLGMGPANKRAVFVVGKDGKIAYSQETASPGDMPDMAALEAAVKGLP